MSANDTELKNAEYFAALANEQVVKSVIREINWACKEGQKELIVSLPQSTGQIMENALVPLGFSIEKMSIRNKWKISWDVVLPANEPVVLDE